MPNPLPQIMSDVPTKPSMNWGGYFHKKDPTLLPNNVLIYPSQNCFVPDTDRVVPRCGEQYIGQDFILSYNNLAGVFLVGETVTGGTSGAIGLVYLSAVGQLFLVATNGDFVSGETVTGGTSGATATVVSYALNIANDGIVGHQKKYTNLGGVEMEVRVWQSGGTKGDIIEVLYTNPLTGVEKWWPITENINPLPIMPVLPLDRRYYFAEYWDSNIDGISLNISRLVWVNGLNTIFSWTGGIAPILSLVVNTSISIDPTLTWESLGFMDPANGGSGNIVINGVVYTPTGGWDTNTLLLASTAGIAVNDIAFDQIQTDVITAPNIINYSGLVGTFQLNETITGGTSGATAIVIADDGSSQLRITAIAGSFTIGETITGGTSGATATIDSYLPATTAFDYCWSVQNYVHYGNWKSRNMYASNAFNHESSANITRSYAFQNDLIVSGGQLYNQSFPSIVRYEIVDVVSDPQRTSFYDASVSTVGDDAFFSQTTIPTSQIVINVTIDGTTPDTFTWSLNGAVQAATVAITGNQQALGATGVSIAFGNLVGHAMGDNWSYTLGGTDKYDWFLNGVLQASGVLVSVPVTSPLIGGVTMKTNSTFNHVVGDYWEVTLSPKVDRAWKNFYYTLPVRKPGEGFTYQLQSNFWTMAAQESVMYVNDAHGQWGYLETKLSADLQSESVSFIPLKQASRNKVIYPYMIGYLDDDLVYVTEDKNLDRIGRKKFLELPQIGNLSDAIQLDFLASSFYRGSIEYTSKKLWITSPEDGVMMCFDKQKGYWHPPQFIPENGILSVVGNELISHSHLRSLTNTLYAGTQGNGYTINPLATNTGNDNGSAFSVIMRIPYMSYGTRWQMKSANTTFIEGYLLGAPNIDMYIYLNINGCKQVLKHLVNPIPCVPPDEAPIGEGNLGSHGLGNDPTAVSTYFQEVYNKFKGPFDFYFVSLELRCSSLDQNWSLLSMGLNAILGNKNNSLIKPRGVINI